MKRLLLTLLLVTGVFAAPRPSETYNTTITVRLADPVDRRIFGLGIVPEEFYFSFRTTYRVRGELVKPEVFW